MAKKASFWKRKIDPKAAYTLIGIAAFCVMAEALILRYAVGRAYAVAFERITHAPVPHFGEEELAQLYSVYTDPTYGFSFRLPSSWQGMVVSRCTIHWAAAGNVPTVDFSLKAGGATARMFSIHAMSGEQWRALEADGELRRVGERDGRVFAAAGNAEIPEELSDRAAEVEGIFETFDAS